MMVLEQREDAVTIFLHPGSPQELEKRLRDRGTETEESVQRRLEVARREMEMMHCYQHEVVNRDVDRAAEEICEILRSYETDPSDNPVEA